MLCGIPDDLNMDSNLSMKKNIEQSEKREILSIIAKKTLFGWKEIITGKEFLAYQQTEKWTKVPTCGLFVMDDRFLETPWYCSKTTLEDINIYTSYWDNKEAYLEHLNQIEKYYKDLFLDKATEYVENKNSYKRQRC